MTHRPLPPTPLPIPAPGRDEAVAWVRTHLGRLSLEGSDGVAASPDFRGGQAAADARLAGFDVTGYARARNEVWPAGRRGASALSPYIRHGLLSLPRVWRHVAGGPAPDVRKYRDELLWQEYARHVYARLGRATGRSLRFEAPDTGPPPTTGAGTGTAGWDRRMACLELTVGELERSGWLVNQSRMWLASHWTVRGGWGWRSGEETFFQHLLDGSRAANRLGWQWTVGAGTGRPYGFSRRQVQRRAPGVCEGCALRHACPVQDWPPERDRPARADGPDRLLRDPEPDATAGPREPVLQGPAPRAVWLTAESLGDDDPALAAHPDLAVEFVLDAPLLAGLRLSGKRLVFLTETLADLATRREVRIHLGDPAEILAGTPLAVTHAPVPGFRRLARRLAPAAVHPWPWLVHPHGGNAGSFSSWRRAAGR